MIGVDFIGDDLVVLVFGDNLFYGLGFGSCLQWFEDIDGGVVFVYWVGEFQVYGVVEFDDEGCVVLFEEKLVQLKSNYVVFGFYFYDNDVVEIVCNFVLSVCGEYEIMDVNCVYLECGKFQVEVFLWGIVWLDIGIFDQMMDVVEYVCIMEWCIVFKIGVLEEVVWCQGFLSDDELCECVEKLVKLGYGVYLFDILKRGYV